MKLPSIREQLASGLPEQGRKLNARLLDELAESYSSWNDEHLKTDRKQRRLVRRKYGKQAVKKADQDSDRRDSAAVQLRRLVEFLGLFSQQLIDDLSAMDRRHEEFRQVYRSALNRTEQQRLIVEYAGAMGRNRNQLQGDRRAFDRCFGEDAINDRHSRRLGLKQQLLAFAVERYGWLCGVSLQRIEDADQQVVAWERLQLEELFHQVSKLNTDPRLEAAALRCLRLAAEAVVATTPLSSQTAAHVLRSALNANEDIWVQCESLSLLGVCQSSAIDQVLDLRLTPHDADGDLFFRRHCVRMLSGDWPARHVDLLQGISTDPSPFVRQQLAEVIYTAPAEAAAYWIHELATQDPEPKVSAKVLVEGLKHLSRRELRQPFLRTLASVLRTSEAPFLTRTALHVAAEWTRIWVRNDGPKGEDADEIRALLESEIAPAVRSIQTGGSEACLRRWASACMTRIWVLRNGPARELFDYLQTRLAGLRVGRSRTLARSELQGHSQTTVGRVLAALAQTDFGYDLKTTWRGYRITRGPVFRFRAWRFLYELTTPSTDKRQGYNHTIGRVSDAELRAPSTILAELSQTKVPGEPLFLPDEGGWRPYLPLVDDLISVLQVGWLRSRPVRFFCNEGVTTVCAPANPIRRLSTYLLLSTRFSKFAALRNWQERGHSNPDGYVSAVRRLGFRIEFEAHGDKAGEMPGEDDASVTRFFLAGAALLAFDITTPVRRFAVDFATYFGSLYENSLVELLLFTTLILIVFLAKHFHANFTLCNARKRLAISIGGWGTRGKSGTERLKTALMNALGHSVFSKSSGCEAMFMYGDAFNETRELLLYRPNDKATIWEHRNVLRMAAELKSSVFLWECMGLTPAYVDVLQRQWTRDDLATITNTYPDHEDLQGPAGRNVAEVIAGFIPPHCKVLTTEQQMLPILVEEADRVDAELHNVGWLESGLLTDDVLGRFPYEEHPDNIALVLALAGELGVEADFALKEMADRIAPDLGVLKAYPVAPVGTRRLEFVNGMSANERFGCLGNWSRMKFDQQDPLREPGVWITTVVNNRADRVSRSRVFARIMVQDISADRHFLIGNNLTGLQGFIWEAWEEFSAGASLWNTDQTSNNEALREWAEMAKRFRQVVEERQIEEALGAMLDGLLAEESYAEEKQRLKQLWRDPDLLRDELGRIGVNDRLIHDLLLHLDEWVNSHNEYRQLAELVRRAETAQRPDLERQFQELLRNWFQRKLVVVENYEASGDQLVHRFSRETPPGFLNRMMGLQNIKGTGLDFVYRWQAWEKCHQASQRLQSPKPAIARAGLESLAEFQEFGVLSEAFVRQAVDKARQGPASRRESFQAELDNIADRLEAAMQRIAPTLDETGAKRGGVLEWFVEQIESFMDVSDGIHRRKKADRVYRDLVDERISWQRAEIELQALVKRQKGGWLAESLGKKTISFQPKDRSALAPARAAQGVASVEKTATTGTTGTGPAPGKTGAGANKTRPVKTGKDETSPNKTGLDKTGADKTPPITNSLMNAKDD